MSKTLYETNWHYVEEDFSHCSVTPITVVRHGVLEGSTGVTITAIDSKGERFLGSPDNYHETEAEAWAGVRAEIEETVKAHKLHAAYLQKEIGTMTAFLKEIESR